MNHSSQTFWGREGKGPRILTPRHYLGVRDQLTVLL